MTNADLKTITPILGNVLLGVMPDSYYELKFKVGGKWYSGYYEHLYGGSFRAYAWWTSHFSRQTTIDKCVVSDWYYTQN